MLVLLGSARRRSVTPTSRPVHLRRPTRILRQVCSYLAAIVLPWLGIVLSVRTPALESTPLALSFIAVAALTILAGFFPGLLAVASTVFFVNHDFFAPHGFLSFRPKGLLYSAVALAVGFIIVFLCDRQRVIAARLRVTVASLEARTDSLIAAQQASNSAAWMFHAGSRVLQWAEGGAEVFGRPFPRFDALEDSTAVIIEEDRARVLQTFESAFAAGTPFHVEFRIRWPNGDLHWLESRGTPSPVNASVWHGVTLDITERKNAEFALVRSEKLAAIGRLSATIAHEVNNPLEAVTNLLFLALSDPMLSPDTRDHLQRADQELARLGAIARRTLTFVRPKSSSGPVDPGEVAESVVAMFEPRAAARGASIDILRNGDLTLHIPTDDLRQILTNIVSNACDALPPIGGRIEVDLVRNDTDTCISVRDNGSSIAPENLSRVFDPFFTTKEDVGTGIGLWVTRDLVEKNGGCISVQTRGLPAGFHTQFRVEFPVAAPEPPAVAAAPPAASAR